MAPNMTEFLANLNAPVQDFNETEDLNLFATTDFLNLDFGDSSVSANDVSQSAATGGAKDASSPDQWISPSTFMQNDFQFTSFNPILSPTNGPIDSLNAFNLSDITGQHSSSIAQSQQQANNKRKLVDVNDITLPPTERARVEAEEDKRRRNTAASARFRVKKKQREQALEKSAKEMTEKSNALEKKVAELELENRWLKGLITERGVGAENIGDLWTKFLANGGDKKEAGRKSHSS